MLMGERFRFASNDKYEWHNIRFSMRSNFHESLFTNIEWKSLDKMLIQMLL